MDIIPGRAAALARFLTTFPVFLGTMPAQNAPPRVVFFSLEGVSDFGVLSWCTIAAVLNWANWGLQYDVMPNSLQKDGPTDAAGAFGEMAVVAQCAAAGLDPTAYLEDNDSYTLFGKGGMLSPGSFAPFPLPPFKFGPIIICPPPLAARSGMGVPMHRAAKQETSGRGGLGDGGDAAIMHNLALKKKTAGNFSLWNQTRSTGCCRLG